VPVEPVQTLILLAVVANLAVMASVVLPPLLGRRGSASGSGSSVDAGDRHSLELAALVGDTDVDLGDQGSVPPGAYDRVVRIVSWVFILATSTIVAVTGLWRDTQPAIFALLAGAGLFVLVVHDLLPAGAAEALHLIEPAATDDADHARSEVPGSLPNAGAGARRESGRKTPAGRPPFRGGEKVSTGRRRGYGRRRRDLAAFFR